MFYFVISKISLAIVYRFVIMFTSVSLSLFSFLDEETRRWNFPAEIKPHQHSLADPTCLVSSQYYSERNGHAFKNTALNSCLKCRRKKNYCPQWMRISSKGSYLSEELTEPWVLTSGRHVVSTEQHSNYSFNPRKLLKLDGLWDSVPTDVDQLTTLLTL